MKCIVFLLSIFLSCTCIGQSEKEKLYIKVICGAGTQNSEEIESFKLISSAKDSAEIRNKLIVGSDIEQVLSAILLLHYSSNGIFKLSHNELTKIKILSKSRRKFILCFTCTYHEEGTLKKLFKQKLAAFEIIKQYLLGNITAANIGLL